MKKGDPEDTKLIVVPSRLVERLRAVAVKQRVSLSSYTTEALEQALRSEELGTSPRDAVDLYQLIQVQKGSGAVHIPRSSLDHLLGELYPDNEEELRRIWFEAGRWYGEYLRTKLRGEDVLGFFEKALLISWNLDEVEINNDDGGITLRCTSFMMALESTELLISYISGAMHSLGYEEQGRDYLRGMATVQYKRSLNTVEL